MVDTGTGVEAKAMSIVRHAPSSARAIPPRDTPVINIVIAKKPELISVQAHTVSGKEGLNTVCVALQEYCNL